MSIISAQCKLRFSCLFCVCRVLDTPALVVETAEERELKLSRRIARIVQVNPVKNVACWHRTLIACDWKFSLLPLFGKLCLFASCFHQTSDDRSVDSPETLSTELCPLNNASFEARCSAYSTAKAARRLVSAYFTPFLHLFHTHQSARSSFNGIYVW